MCRRKAYAEGADAALNNRRQVEDVKANPVRTSPGVHDGAYFERLVQSHAWLSFHLFTINLSVEENILRASRGYF